MTHETPPTILTTVPTAVQHHIRLHLGVLCEITQGIVQARAMEQRAGMPGRYEYDFRYGGARAQARLEASLASLAEIQALVEAKSLDWHALCTALGGWVTPPAVGPAVGDWRPRGAPPAQDA